MSEGRLDPRSVLGKAMAVLRAFTAEDGLGFAELQRRTGLPKATLHRVAGDLVTARLLERRDGVYHLGRQLFELGMLASVERTLLEVATPFLEDLYERTHETVHLGVREGAEVVYVAKVTGHRQVKAPSRIGGRMPVHSTAVGKALLAFAPEAVRVQVLTGPLERRTPALSPRRAGCASSWRRSSRPGWPTSTRRPWRAWSVSRRPSWTPPTSRWPPCLSPAPPPASTRPGTPPRSVPRPRASPPPWPAAPPSDREVGVCAARGGSCVHRVPVSGTERFSSVAPRHDGGPRAGGARSKEADEGE
ncbi:MAG: IclR family transcriptional regulator [Nocardioides sp.]